MKDSTIMIRVTNEQKLAIKNMARKKGMTVTEFMLLSMMRSINNTELNEFVTSDMECFKKLV